jgi:methionyl-tRNA formyltransferase
LIENGRDIAGVVGAPESSDQAGYASLKPVCDESQIPIVETENMNEPSTVSFIKDCNPDVGICCGWTDIIADDVLDIPRYGVLGIHSSSLPAGRGGAPVNWQIIHDMDHVGVSLFQFSNEVDHGDIYAQTTVSVEERDDVKSVYNKVTFATFDLLNKTIDDIEQGNITTQPQSFDDATYFPQRKPKDGIVDWGRDPLEQWNWIRAQTTPYPGAFTFLDGKKLTILSSEVASEVDPRANPAEIKAIVKDSGIEIGTGEGTVRITRVQFDGEPPMWADDFAFRHNLSVGDSLGTPEAFPEWLYTGVRDEDGGFDYATNVTPGSDVTYQAVACSHHNRRKVNIEGYLNGIKIGADTLNVSGWVEYPFHLKITEPGANLFKLVFSEKERTIDSRFIKIYSP